MTEFSSLFGDRIAGFLDYRVARGFKRDSWLRHFIKFDRWCAENHPVQEELSRDFVHCWIGTDITSTFDLSQRVSAMRQFGRYLCAIGEDAYVLPEKYAPMKSYASAYIFTDAEMTALFSAIDRLPSTKNEPFFDVIAPPMFRMIYTCGLRPNEGRELLTENVNLETGEILITHTKRNKERLVVMSDDMLAFARQYESKRKIICNGSPYFFPSANGKALTAQTIYSAFNRAWSHADLVGKYPGKVRVYDLRHRFASACLNRWLDQGENLMAMLPFLRAYMGHSTLTETAYYIHILPENLLKSSAIDWDKFNSMFPEVMEE